MDEIDELEMKLIRGMVGRLYRGNRGADCPSIGTMVLRLLGELEGLKKKKEKKV